VDESLHALGEARLEEVLETAEHHLAGPARAVHHVRAAAQGRAELVGREELHGTEIERVPGEPPGAPRAVDERDDGIAAPRQEALDERRSHESRRADDGDPRQAVCRSRGRYAYQSVRIGWRQV